MKKVYTVVRIMQKVENGEVQWTESDIIHICKDRDLAVEYANSYVNDSVHDALKNADPDYPIVYLDSDKLGRYLTESELSNGAIYISDMKNGERYKIKIEEYELKVD